VSPYKPQPLCLEQGCGQAAVRQGRCREHMRETYTRIERQRGSSTARGYDVKWRRLRDWFIAANPVCRVCGGLAHEVDHVQPLVYGGARLDPANLQALCRRCHGEKTGREHQGRA